MVIFHSFFVSFLIKALRDREIDWQSSEQAEETTPPVQEM